MDIITTKELLKFNILCKDEPLGKVEDLYFDKNSFYLRYLLVNTEHFVLKDYVLVSPISFSEIDLENKTITLSVTKERLENTPTLNNRDKISIIYEEHYNQYFGWPFYWTGSVSPWDVGPYGIPWNYYTDNSEIKNLQKKSTQHDKLKDQLYSALDMHSFSIHAEHSKGNFGHIQGFLINSSTMAIDYIIVDTIKYIPSKLVVLRPEWIQDVHWDEQEIIFPFSKDVIKNAPDFRMNHFDTDCFNQVLKYFKPHLNEIAQKELIHDNIQAYQIYRCRLTHQQNSPNSHLDPFYS
ncbi:MAG: PRC-barrel domain-containing protein [Halobacteriovoraceae bacterium]|nr:PRC-barrel domain-containing protein [Halobacteriovoraceae bacterium]MCB9095296.1 PRC-barrel domain-containing protein [Halobacteriovoraceae bacterium]